LGGNKWQDITNGNKQKLPDLKIKELTKIAVKLENFYGFPIDLEWALKDDTLFILQSRPITTL
jgi:phosphoenolpyruvate synthase/pyruvate phosphate dikinase